MKNKILTASFLLLLAILFSGCTHEDDTMQTETESRKPMTESEMKKENKAMDKKMSYTDVSPKEARELIASNPGVIIIDVSPHYAKGRLPGSVNYYLGDGSLDKAIPNLNKENTYLVYCHVDSVSIAGAQKLIDAGFENVYRLEGNYKAWIDAGYPVEK